MSKFVEEGSYYSSSAVNVPVKVQVWKTQFIFFRTRRRAPSSCPEENELGFPRLSYEFFYDRFLLFLQWSAPEVLEYNRASYQSGR